jgi:preprotein translocase SecF subunit
MRMIQLPYNTKIPFMRWRKVAFTLTGITSLASIVLFLTVGLNLGIDFRGGTVVELRFEEPVDVAEIRSQVGEFGFGDVQIVEFGSPTDVLIRVAQQPGGDEAQQVVIQSLRELYDAEADFRRVEVVGPRVSGELAQTGILAVVIALAGILIYLWFRFEWQYAVGAVLTTLHDVILTIGFFTVTQLDFSLSSLAAILTVIGYSLNDTVVIYDRVRENLRKYKRMPLPELLDVSMNDVLSRSIMTSVTTLLALVALFVIGGEVIQTFVLPLIWGIVVGTYSSIFVSAPLLISFNLRPSVAKGEGAADTAPAKT